VTRLDELLSRNLGVSKGVVGKMVDDERVTNTDGVPFTDRKAALPASDAPPVVLVDGEPITLFAAAVVLQHKPVGVVTALRDSRHPTAYSLLQDAPLASELRPTGRLDLDSTGLLIWTTDGMLIQRLTHPKRRVPRTYQAALAGPFQPLPPDLTLEDGYRPDIVELRALSRTDVHPGLLMPEGAAHLATITIIGGAYHEVRRIFVALGSHVLALCRVQFGPYTLPADLHAGGWRIVSADTPT
jgi:16S rRNA pseudouridine516 synthase